MPTTTLRRNLATACSVLLLIAAGASALADEGETRRHRIVFGLTATDWNDMDELAPRPVDAVARGSGAFEDVGFGVSVGYHHPLGAGQARWWVGGEFSFFLHGNREVLVARNVAGGGTSTIELGANWGSFTGGFLRVWAPTDSLEIVAGAGVGLYVLRITEQLEDFGNFDRSESDSSLGGYGTLGLRFPIGKRSFAVRVESRLHWVAFKSFGSTFAGQTLDGPVPSIFVGADYNF